MAGAARASEVAAAASPAIVQFFRVITGAMMERRY